MTPQKERTTVGFTLILLLISLLALAALPVSVTRAEGLPPRDTLTPSPHRDHKGDDDSDPAGAYLELIAPNARAGAWAIVQWQDSAGGWQNVEGWQGPAASSSRWWVHPKDFGSGPFRWLVKQGPGGTEWGVSEPFNLPGFPGQTLPVTAAAK